MKRWFNGQTSKYDWDCGKTEAIEQDYIKDKICLSIRKTAISLLSDIGTSSIFVKFR